MAGIELGIEGLDECRVIGAGGFATVYSALDVRFGRTVAVKILANVDEDGRRRFDREQLSMGKLSDHAHVVTAFSSGFTNGGQPYIIMEHLSGGSLADIIDRGETLPWAKAVRYATAIARALGHAHSQGVLHRDVKPENILVSSEGIAKLADFGISSVREGVATQAVGFSLAHAPPETFQDGEDNRGECADLYSLASSLLTVVRGQAPYESPGGNSQMAYMMRISDHPIPQLGDLRYDNFLATAMAKDPSHRFQNANEFIDALATTLLPIEDQPHLTPPASATVVDSSPQTTPGETTLFEEETGGTNQTSSQPLLPADAPPPIDPRPEESPQPEQTDTGGPEDQESARHPAEPDQPPPAESTPDLVPQLLGSESQPVESSEIQMAALKPTPKNLRKKEGVFESAETVIAKREPSTETVRKERQKGIIVAAVIGLIAIALFLIYLLRPAPQNVETTTPQTIEILASEQSSDLNQATTEDRSNGAAGVAGGPHTDAVNDLIGLGNNQFASTSDDGTVLIWDANDEQAEPIGFKAAAGLAITHSLALSNGRVVSRRSDDAAIIWDPTDLGSEPLVFEGRASTGGFAETADGRIVSVDPSNKALVLWNPDSTDQDGTDQDSADGATVIAGDDSLETFEPVVEIALQGNSVVTASKDHQLTLWTLDGESGEAMMVPGAFAGSHTDTINDVLILADGTVASASDDGTVLLQRPDGGNDEVIVFDEHPRDVFDLVQFEDGRIGSGGIAASIVWNPENPKWVQDEEQTGLISRLGRTTKQVILSDGRLAVANFKDVVVWDPNRPSSSPIATESSGSKTHDGDVTALLALDDGRVVSADDEGAVHIWNPDDNG